MRSRRPAAAAISSGAGVEPVQFAGPSKDLVVSGDESVALMVCTGDDDAIRGVTVHPGEEARPQRDAPIGGKLNESGFQQTNAPRIQIETEVEATFLDAHRHCPEGNAR